MNKKSSIIKLTVVGILLAIGLLATFLTFPVGVYDYNGFIYSIDLGLDLEGGIYAVYEAADDEDPSDSMMNGTVSQLSELLYSKGYTEAVVTREGTRKIRVEVPDVDDPSSIFTIIGEPAEIEFALESSEGVYDNVVMTGSDVADAIVTTDTTGSYAYSVQLTLTTEGAATFAEVTTNNIDKAIQINVIRGGVSTTVSTATIQTAITNGVASITGDFTYEEATELADQIMSGTFSVTLELLESSIVSATLGENALLSGIIGGAIAFLLIIAFMCIFYRMFGVVASISMLIYMVLMFMFLAILPWVQLTLPGIAGIILSLGMMIDGNIIIYERIKDEYREGKSILAAYYAGFKKASSAIIDGNITTIIAAIMLLIFGSGTIQGFGLTLLVGLILSIISSLVITRFILKWIISFNTTDKNLYNLKRKPGFNEADELQYVAPVSNEETNMENNFLMEGGDNE